ncbi:Hypothetical protein NTJ_13332 [Nesidiocoris tenuis]|uniref:MADF domain-containing protein n=1 Tax=Nesidiocoris tenuis TaxID=355587 RepID=A0ABN7BBF4_9HEMI|nr:Hypothetical protein NTJ_13332 [Nesidiocoris tenuis]
MDDRKSTSVESSKSMSSVTLFNSDDSSRWLLRSGTNGSTELTCLVSEMNIFKANSKSSKKKFKEIKDFYRRKILNSRAEQTPALGFWESDCPAFDVLMRSSIEAAPSDCRLVNIESLADDAADARSAQQSQDDMKPRSRIHSVASEVSEISAARLSSTEPRSSSIFAQMANLLASFFGRNKPAQSCSFECESQLEPLRRCQKTMDVRKAIPN